MFGKKETREPVFERSGEKQSCQPDLAEKARRLFQLQQQRKTLEQEERGLRDELDKRLEAGDKIILPGECQVAKVESRRMEVTDPERLQKLLGARYDDLVHVSTSYKLEQRLLQMLDDIADPLCNQISECVQARQSLALRVTAAA